MKTYLPLLVAALLASVPTWGDFCSNRQWPSFEVESISQSDSSRPKRKSEWTIKAHDYFGDYQIHVTYFAPTKRQRNFWGQKDHADNLIIFPTIDGESLLEGQLARYFSARAYHVAIVSIEEINQGHFDNLTTCRMDGMYRRIQDSAQIVDQQLQELNPEGALFLAGASQGGIRSLIASKALPYVKGVWANVPGGDFPSLYAQSQVEGITNFRERHMQFLEIDQADHYEDYLREHLSYDPLTACSKLDAPLSLVIATADTSVPTHNQRLLLNSCPQARVKEIDSGHFRGVIDLYFSRIKVRRFFESADQLSSTSKIAL